MVGETLKNIGRKMKKLFNCMFGLIYFCHSCASTNQSNDYLYEGWSLLKEAKSLDCETWEKTKNELEIKGLTPLSSGEKFSYFVESQDRRGKFMRYIAQSDDGLDVDRRMSLSWGGEDRYIADFMFAGKSVILMQRKNRQGKSSLELRDSIENIVVASSEQLILNYEAVASVYDDKWLWVAYRLDSDDQVSVDQEIFVAKYMVAKGKLNQIEVLKLKMNGELALVRSSSAKQAFLIIRDVHTEKSQSGRNFVVFNLTNSTKKKLQKMIVAKSKEKVESWGFVIHGDKLYLSFISGDTLLWENAKLNLIGYDFQGAKQVDTDFDIENIHVGDVRLISHSIGPIIVIPQWLGDESTVGLYGLVDGQLKSIGSYGVFNQGTEFFGAYTHAHDRKVFILNRSNESIAKKYSICNVDL